jgi:hypothetical protein
MLKKLLPLSVLVVLICFSISARAGAFFFGTQESIQFVANTTIPGPGQSNLYLGHRVTMKAFLLPYYVESKGYVFGISGESKKYMPLPSGPTLTELQAKGFLPNPLPPAQLGWFNYLLGYSLWLALFVIFGVPFLKKKIFGPKAG